MRFAARGNMALVEERPPRKQRSPGVPGVLGVLGVLASTVVSTTGCIARTLTVESDPPGAEVRLNGRDVGPTPVTVPFRHYGVYRVELRKDGFETLDTEEEVLAPAYARFPVCLFTEFLWPGTIRDERYLSYQLEEPRASERAGLLERADAEAAGLVPPGP